MDALTTWRFEDGGPQRRQTVPGALGLADGGALAVTTRTAPAVTMAVHDAAGGLFLLRHTAGDGAVAVVEQVDPITLEPLAQSSELSGGPVWPGGIGLHDNGSLYVVFGNHAHRLDDLRIVARLTLPEPSIARLSADGDDVYVVGDTSLLRLHWDGAALHLDEGFTARYRTLEGQTYGWDCVLAAGAAWFLDDGDGSERYSGTLRGNGLSTAPLHLVRVDLATSKVTLAEVCGLPGGLVANPPVVDEQRGIVVGYDSGNGVVVGFDLDGLSPRWRRQQDHGSHLLLYAGSGELVTGDGSDVVVLDITTGEELARADTGSGMQSVLFPTPGTERDFYVCTFLTVSRVVVH